MAREIILTGAPGAGKTLILRALDAAGTDVVEEAATDVIALEQGQGVAEPWTRSGFIEAIARLQVQRLSRPSAAPARVSDRSLICTLALAEYLGVQPPEYLVDAIDYALSQAVFERRVMFVALLGFMENTTARQISYPESQRFEAVHVAAYERLGFELVWIPPLPVAARAELVRSHF